MTNHKRETPTQSLSDICVDNRMASKIKSSAGTPNWENRTLFHGDNLKFLRAMNSESVHLIATDPPFNKGRDFHATPDSLASGASFQDRWSWDRDVHQEWVDQITDDFPKVMNVIEGSRNSYGDDMGAFLCFMAVRLLELHRVLRNDGSIYLHCDPTASHYLKELMDSIFDKRNFRNEIIWKRTTTKKGSTRKFGAVHDTILFYTKSNNYFFTPVYLEHDKNYIDKAYRHSDRFGRYRVGDLTAAGKSKGSSSKPWRGVSVPQGKHWACATNWPTQINKPDDWDALTTQEKLDYMDSVGLIYWPKRGKMPGFKRYLSTSKGSAMTGLITDIGQIEGQAREKVGYPTQKPLALYGRFIEASSRENDVILDPFAGCATTLVAAERLGRQWVGMDIWDKVKDVVVDRLEDEGLIAPKYTRDTVATRQTFLFAKDLHFISNPPARTDDGEEAVPFLKTKLRVDEPKDMKMSRAEMLDFLLGQCGSKCQGCDREFDDSRYLELDHNTPRSDGGLNHISNRVLLCGPCNKVKSNQYTLSGLRRLNQKNGWMAK